MTRFREMAEKILSKSELLDFHGSFDVIGDIAILEIDKKLEKKEKKLGELLLTIQPNIHTVCKKVGNHSGKYRTQKLKIIAGKRKKETIHLENGVRIKTHVDKAYFTPRLASDRLAIAKQVQPHERILVMFSGVGPYGLVIGKLHKNSEIHQIELNPHGHTYCLENIKLNKMDGRVFAHYGDVRKIALTLGQFDRIIMPLPKDAGNFLDIAKKCSHHGTILNYYTFGHEDELENEKKKFLEICQTQEFPVLIKTIIKCGAYKPRVFRLRIDAEVI